MVDVGAGEDDGCLLEGELVFELEETRESGCARSFGEIVGGPKEQPQGETDLVVCDRNKIVEAGLQGAEGQVVSGSRR